MGGIITEYGETGDWRLKSPGTAWPKYADNSCGRGSSPALIAISPELWNTFAERLEYLEDAVAIYKKKWELATGQDEMIELSPETIYEGLS
jgi:hypothetical protein